jgi:hypothetical protein
MTDKEIEEFFKSSVEKGWYASEDGERFTSGPVESRQEIIEIAKSEQCGIQDEKSKDGKWVCIFEIIYAERNTLRISDHINMQNHIEDLCCSYFQELSDPEGNEDLIRLNKEEYNSINETVKRSIDEWQTKNNKKFYPYCFDKIFDREDILVVFEDD